MADYLVVPDDYAGWNPTGRNFACISAAICGVGMLSWLALHGRLGVFHPTAAADEMFLGALVWVGVGGFVLMLIAAFGSISLSLKSRGSVSITAEGIQRTTGKRNHYLAWNEIEGFVPNPYGGVTIISASSKPRIVIPRFLDDYRACIAELKDHGLQPLPPSRLQAEKRKTGWMQSLMTFIFVMFYLSATQPHYSHFSRIAFLCIALAILLSILYRDRSREQQGTSMWFSALGICGLVAWAVWRMAHTW